MRRSHTTNAREGAGQARPSRASASTPPRVSRRTRRTKIAAAVNRPAAPVASDSSPRVAALASSRASSAAPHRRVTNRTRSQPSPWVSAPPSGAPTAHPATAPPERLVALGALGERRGDDRQRAAGEVGHSGEALGPPAPRSATRPGEPASQRRDREAVPMMKMRHHPEPVARRRPSSGSSRTWLVRR